jgi:hypothetical protein
VSERILKIIADGTSSGVDGKPVLQVIMETRRVVTRSKFECISGSDRADLAAKILGQAEGAFEDHFDDMLLVI